MVYDFKRESINVNETVRIELLFFDDFEIDDYIAQLSDSEGQRVGKFLLPKRKREFIATRLLKNELFGSDSVIAYRENGAPFLEKGPAISISHAPNVAGIAFSEDVPVGFDLEPVREKVHRIKEKFLHRSEYTNFDPTSTADLIKLWSSKETLFKLAGREGVVFAEDLCLVPLSENRLKGNFRVDNQWYTTEIAIFTREDLIITVNTNDVQRTKSDF